MSPHNAFHVAGDELYFGPWLFAHLPDYTQLPCSIRDELVEALLAANDGEREQYVLVIRDGPAPPAA